MLSFIVWLIASQGVCEDAVRRPEVLDNPQWVCPRVDGDCQPMTAGNPLARTARAIFTCVGKETVGATMTFSKGVPEAIVSEPGGRTIISHWPSGRIRKIQTSSSTGRFIGLQYELSDTTPLVWISVASFVGGEINVVKTYRSDKPSLFGHRQIRRGKCDVIFRDKEMTEVAAEPCSRYYY